MFIEDEIEQPDHTENRGGRVMALNATFNNISVISWRSVLLVEKTAVPGQNHRHWQTLSHNVISSTSCHERDSNSQPPWCNWNIVESDITHCKPTKFTTL